MIKCHLSTLLGARKLKIADVVRDTGINRSTVNRLFHETNNRIDFEALEKLCLYLNCTVGELLEVIPDNDLQVD
ncbi:helix-turn-helix domain-containing protein [Vibrio genomosp. F10]|uniref:helix-turn-helix domain-containing protein n=1 Tax=Vibrio genomosp. F10 TaxID=723171 RepID=UPI0002DF6BBC|nr:helix-turn-helix transcriptional regulator [Vibrio genomosp. F10]OEE93838.1 transcriptional regulator [Vibrio genomosp. F10 str. 9ZD137]OEF06744.1 transcriptional regulator [Vibrio genomosp. F10 str. 9ZB36]